MGRMKKEIAKELGFIDMEHLKKKYPCDRLITLKVGNNWYYLMVMEGENEIGDPLTITGHKISDREAALIEKYGRGYD